MLTWLYSLIEFLPSLSLTGRAVRVIVLVDKVAETLRSLSLLIALTRPAARLAAVVPDTA